MAQDMALNCICEANRQVELVQLLRTGISSERTYRSLVNLQVVFSVFLGSFRLGHTNGTNGRMPVDSASATWPARTEG